MSLDDLGRRVAAEQDALLRDSDAVQSVRVSVEAMRFGRRRTPSWTRWGAVAAVAAVAAAALLVLWLRPRAPVPLTFSVSGERASSGTWISTEPAAVTGVHFSDGSFFALSDGARARVESVTPDGAHLVMEQGSVSADVVHRPTSHWSVLAGPYEVHVTGTQFHVSWMPARGRIEVHVTRGSVVVSGGGIAPHTVTTGGDYVFEPTAAQLPAPAATQVAIDRPVASQAASSSGVDDRRPPQTPAPASAPRWRELAGAGDYADAVDAVRRAGVDGVIARSGPADLLALADAARLSQNPDIAEKSLLALRRRFPKDAERSRAAFDLGRLAFDQRHDYTSAATWFATYLKETPDGPLAREAAGRLIEARQHAGDGSGARSAARDYLSRYPEGPHAPLARNVLLSEP